MDREARFQRELKRQLEKWEDEITKKRELLNNCTTATSNELKKEILKLEKYISEGKARFKEIKVFYDDVLPEQKNDAASFWQRLKSIFTKRRNNDAEDSK